ncbi:Chloride intracellular channel protein 1 [Mactra antiquata]
MSTEARFQLFVKAGKDGKSIGDCPFSQRVNMFTGLTLNNSDVEIIPINTSDKPDYFLKLNPEGKVPVLVDRHNNNKIIPDSGEITRYINELFPKPEVHQGYSGPAIDAASGIFPKFAAMMTNKDSSKNEELKANLVAELRKLNDFLAANINNKYLLCDNVCELDCQVLPKLRHIQVAGTFYKSFNIPEEFTTLTRYIKEGEACDVFKNSCPPDEEIIWGWSKFFT